MGRFQVDLEAGSNPGTDSLRWVPRNTHLGNRKVWQLLETPDTPYKVTALQVLSVSFDRVKIHMADSNLVIPGLI